MYTTTFSNVFVCLFVCLFFHLYSPPEKFIMCLEDEERSEVGSSWIGFDGPCGRWYHQSCFGMDEEDVGSLSEEKWVCSQCSESSVELSVGKEEIVILVMGKKCWLVSMWI